MINFSNIEQTSKTHFLPENYNAIINPDTIDLLTQDYQHDKPDKIMFTTDSCSAYSKSFTDRITPEFLAENPTFAIPRIYKSLEERKLRTQKKAEVFTPAWIVNKQCNIIDDSWFSENLNDENHKQPFNTENNDNTWTTTKEKINFSQYNKSPIDYIKSTRLEITCGESPYQVSRYNAVDGEFIPVQNRIGFLDRKLRVCNEIFDNEEEWLIAVWTAYCNTYGYEYQGDSLLVARLNLLYTLAENYEYKFHKPLTDKKTIEAIAEVISFNFWQMDGLTMCLPTDKEGFDHKWLNKGKTQKETDKNKKTFEKWIDDNDLVCSKIMDWNEMKMVMFTTLINHN